MQLALLGRVVYCLLAAQFTEPGQTMLHLGLFYELLFYTELLPGLVGTVQTGVEGRLGQGGRRGVVGQEVDGTEGGLLRGEEAEPVGQGLVLS